MKWQFTIPESRHAMHHASLMQNAGEARGLRSAAAAASMPREAKIFMKIVLRNLEHQQAESPEGMKVSYNRIWAFFLANHSARYLCISQTIQVKTSKESGSCCKESEFASEDVWFGLKTECCCNIYMWTYVSLSRSEIFCNNRP